MPTQKQTSHSAIFSIAAVAVTAITVMAFSSAQSIPLRFELTADAASLIASSNSGSGGDSDSDKDVEEEAENESESESSDSGSDNSNAGSSSGQGEQEVENEKETDGSDSGSPEGSAENEHRERESKEKHEGAEVEMEDNVKGSRIEISEEDTKIKHSFLENGLIIRLEMRNQNGKVLIRIKRIDPETGLVVEDERLVVRPEDGRVTFKRFENGVEKEITVKSLAGRFIIEQSLTIDGVPVAVETGLPISIDTDRGTIEVETPFGSVEVSQLPEDAILAAIAQAELDRVNGTELVFSDSDGDGFEQIVYRMDAVKEVHLLGIFKIDAEILAEVSAITAELTFVNQPWYLDAFGFLFS